jgi:hypothetical protein
LSRKGNTFSFRLRKIDADLETAIENIDTNAISDLCRDGLRIVLGLKTTKRIEITELPLFASDANAVVIRSAPAVFIPQKKPKG